MNPFSIIVDNEREISSNGKIYYKNKKFIYDFDNKNIEFEIYINPSCLFYFDCNDKYFVIIIGFNNPYKSNFFHIYKMEDILNNKIEIYKTINKIHKGINNFYLHISQDKLFYDFIGKVYIYEIENNKVAILDDEYDIFTRYYFTNNYKFIILKNVINKYNILTNELIDTINFENNNFLLFEKFYYKDNNLYYYKNEINICLGNL